MQMWALTAGEYADEQLLGVVRANDIAEARRVAAEMTLARIKADEPSDMAYVAVTEVEDLTPPYVALAASAAADEYHGCPDGCCD